MNRDIVKAILLAATVVIGSAVPTWASSEDEIVPDTEAYEIIPIPEREEGQDIISEEESDGEDNLEEIKKEEELGYKGDLSTLSGLFEDPEPCEGETENEGIGRVIITNAQKAAITHAKEYENAAYRYLSDSIYVAVTSHENGKGGKYLLSHIVINDASQINGLLSYDDYAGERENPVDAARRKKAVLLINGSYFRYETNEPNGADVVIADRRIMRGGTADGYEICLREDGELFSPSPWSISAEGLIEQGVKFSWGTCEDCLISNGEKCALTDTDWDYSPYPRTSIGMVKPLEYYIITAGSTGHSCGITVEEEQDIFYGLGCQYARGLDGGGSAALVLKGRHINDSPEKDGSIRNVIDFLCFYDLEEE